jgi:hypothetical protein
MIEHFDVLKDIPCGLVPCAVLTMIDRKLLLNGYRRAQRHPMNDLPPQCKVARDVFNLIRQSVSSSQLFLPGKDKIL